MVTLIDFLFAVPKCTGGVLKFAYNYGYKKEYVCVCAGNWVAWRTLKVDQAFRVDFRRQSLMCGEVRFFTFSKIDIASARRPRRYCTIAPGFRGEILVLRIPWVYRGVLFFSRGWGFSQR